MENNEINIDTEKVESFKKALINSVIENIREMSDEEIKTLMTQDKKFGVCDTLFVPSVSISDGEDTLTKITEINAKDNKHFTQKAKNALWVSGKSFTSSLDDYSYIENEETKRDVFTADGDYDIGYEHNNKKIEMKSLDYKVLLEKTPDNKRVPEDVVLSIFKSFTSSGEIVKIPLWHSGFSVDINPPTVKDIVNTQNAINEDMVRIGNSTINLVYSNISVVSNKHIIDLFLKLINRYTLSAPKEDLLKHISVLDIPTITLGILASMYPQGTTITTACSNTLKLDGDKTMCDFVAKGRIDLKKLLMVDKTKIKNKVSNYADLLLKIAADSVSIQEANKYKEELYKSDLSRQKINVPGEDKMFYLNLKIPTIEEYLEECNYYLDDLENRITDAMGSDYEDKETITSFVISMTYITIYSAFIKSIDVDNTDGKELKLETRSYIYAALTGMSSVGNDPRIVNKAIIDYINDVTCAVTGIKNYVCPSCAKQHSETEDKISILALDKLFFTQATLRTLKSVQQI